MSTNLDFKVTPRQPKLLFVDGGTVSDPDVGDTALYTQDGTLYIKSGSTEKTIVSLEDNQTFSGTLSFNLYEARLTDGGSIGPGFGDVTSYIGAFNSTNTFTPLIVLISSSTGDAQIMISNAVINGSSIGSSTPANGHFTNLYANSNTILTGPIYFNQENTYTYINFNYGNYSRFRIAANGDSAENLFMIETYSLNDSSISFADFYFNAPTSYPESYVSINYLNSKAKVVVTDLDNGGGVSHKTYVSTPSSSVLINQITGDSTPYQDVFVKTTFNENITIADTKNIQSGSSAGDVCYIGSKNTGDSSVAQFITMTSNSTPSMAINQPSGSTLTFDSGVIGGITPAAGTFTNLLATDSFGYKSGSGGSVTQTTSKSTTVTLNSITGKITMNNAQLNQKTSVSFTLNNNKIGSNDFVNAIIVSGASADSYNVDVVGVSSGSCNIQLRNFTNGDLSEAVVIRFIVIKSSDS